MQNWGTSLGHNLVHINRESGLFDQVQKDDGGEAQSRHLVSGCLICPKLLHVHGHHRFISGFDRLLEGTGSLLPVLSGLLTMEAGPAILMLHQLIPSTGVLIQPL